MYLLALIVHICDSVGHFLLSLANCKLPPTMQVPFPPPFVWILGEKGETCNEVCERNCLSCNAAMQSAIVSKNDFLTAIVDLGIQCNNYDSREYAGSPFFNPTNGACRHMKAGKSSVCNANKEAHHQPLCNCRSKFYN